MGGVLELEHRLGVEQVILALPSPLVLPSPFEGAVGPLVGVFGEGDAVSQPDLLGQLRETYTAEAADRAGEALTDDGVAQADGLEDLRPHVRLHRGNAHLGHDLEHTLVAGLDVVVVSQFPVVVGRESAQPLVDHLVDGLECQIRVDGRGPVGLKQADVVYLAGVAGLDHQPHPGAGLLPDEMVVHRRGGQQRRDRR